jgi:hypothetical protein
MPATVLLQKVEEDGLPQPYSLSKSSWPQLSIRKGITAVNEMLNSISCFTLRCLFFFSPMDISTGVEMWSKENQSVFVSLIVREMLRRHLIQSGRVVLSQLFV